jgi:uncharacterized protein
MRTLTGNLGREIAETAICGVTAGRLTKTSIRGMIVSMPAASFLIKPVSGLCNLACRYCFYRDVAENRETADFGRMTEETAAILLDRAFELDAEAYSFGFQGGEPTLAGLPFFERFVDLIRERNKQNAKIHLALQTNGMTLDAEWAKFLKREQFLVGVSIDGPRMLHDAFRVKRDDSGSYAQVMEGVAALRAEDVPVNALCVVDAAVADNAELVYRHLRKRGFDWIQFIPCLDPLGEEPGGRSWSLKPDAYGRFLKIAFDLWFEDGNRGTPANVRWFDNLIGMAMGYPPENCGMSGRCSAYFTIEADGSVYPCDFYVTDEWRMGNLREQSLASMIQGDRACSFIRVSEYVDPECRACFAFPLCRGGCRRDREPFVDGKPVLNRYCAAYKDFFTYAGERIMAMAKAASQNGAVQNEAAPS